MRLIEILLAFGLAIVGGSPHCRARSFESQLPISPSDAIHGHMQTSIAINGVGEPDSTSISHSEGDNQVVINSADLISKASDLYDIGKSIDIDEDDHDRFISSRKGKLRPVFDRDNEEDWAEEAVGSIGSVVKRVKRCGGGGGGGDDDDDGDANRSRRARRTWRRAVKSVNKNNKNKRNKSKDSSKSVTTITKTVYDQNGQVVSQTTEQKGKTSAVTMVQASGQPANIVAAQPATLVAAQPAAPVVVGQHAAAPVVHHTVTTHTVQVQAAPAGQPTVVQATSAPVVVTSAPVTTNSNATTQASQ